MKVPLRGKASIGKTVEIYKEDYDHLLSLGLSTAWRLGTLGYVIAPAHRAKGCLISVARVLLNAGPGQNVKYLDGNYLNLRRENLLLITGGWATRKDRDFLTPRRRHTNATPIE